METAQLASVHKGRGSVETPQRARPLAVELTRAFRPVIWTLLIVLALALMRFGTTWWVDQRLDQLLAADQARSESHDAMLDQETSVRGYLLTADTSFQQAYEQAGEQLDAADPQLLPNVAGDSELGDLLLATWARRDEWQHSWAEVAVATDDLDAVADDDEYVERGKELFDAYRDADAALSSALVGRMDTIRDVDRIVFIVGLALTVLATLVGLAATWRQFSRVRRQVERPLRELLSVIRRVREGDLSAAVQASGPAELREIADELGDTTRALAEERTRADRRELELSRLADVAGRVLDYAQDFSSSLELERVVAAIGRGALPLGETAEARVWLVEHGEEEVVLAHATRDDDVEPVIDPQRRRLGETLPGRAAQLGRTLYERGEDVSARLPPEVDGVALPMIAGGLTIGVLELRADTPGPLDASTHELLEKVSMQAGIAMEAARMHGRTRELVRRDDLSGLLNRRQLDADLAAELARYRRYATPCTFVILDLDHFKDLNDSLGHQVGDQFLRGFARLLDDTVRATDTAYRYGGEEFAVIMRQSHADDAQRMLERLRARGAELVGIGGNAQTITFSGGICEASEAYDEAEFVIRSADRALYEAKRTGRDRWVVTGEVITVDAAEEPIQSEGERRDAPAPA